MEKEKININQETLERLKNDEEFFKYFIKNIDTILTETEAFSIYVLSDFLDNSKLKKAFMKNIPQLMKKMTNREDMLHYLSKSQIKKHVNDFFVEKEPGVDTEFSDIIKTLSKTVIPDKKEMMEVITSNIDNIVLGSGEYLPLTIREISEYYNFATEEQMDKIDSALARNIDEISKIEIDDVGYDFKYLKNMEKFKNEIRKRGKSFFIDFPLFNDIEECKEISKELFGNFDEESFATMIFGNKDEDKVKLIKEITKELLKVSEINNSPEDIKPKGNGCFSDVYQIGEYVLKVGRPRGYNEIPRHRRILQPIIRMNMKSKNKAFGEQYCIEVQNLVDTNWWKEKTFEQQDEELYKVYADMRDDGIVWFDISEENVGKLLKNNNPNFYFMDVDGIKKDIRPDENATSIKGNEEEVLEAGNYVVLDTDYIGKYDEEKMKNRKYEGPRIVKTYIFEERYLRELTKRNCENVENIINGENQHNENQEQDINQDER